VESCNTNIPEGNKTSSSGGIMPSAGLLTEYTTCSCRISDVNVSADANWTDIPNNKAYHFCPPARQSSRGSDLASQQQTMNHTAASHSKA
jgi:hypothetical protein